MPPPGVKPFFFPDSGAVKYGMKTGPGIVDLVAQKSFPTAEILKSILEMGFMCPFDVVEKELKECPLPEFLVVTDTKSLYGEMFLLYYTESAITSKLMEVELAAAAVAEALRKEEEAIEEKRRAEEARRTAVYVDLPIVPRVPYISTTQEETSKEVAGLNIVDTRELIQWSIGRSVKTAGKNLQFGDRDFDVTGILEFRTQKMPEFDLNRRGKNGRERER